MRTAARPFVHALPPRVSRPLRLHRRHLPFSSETEEPQTESSTDEGTSKDLFDGGLFEVGMDPRLFGENVDPDATLPPEFEKDFWEDPRFEFLGVMMQYFVPGLVVAALIVGGIAAKSFNEGATSYFQPATSETETAKIVPADAQLQSPPE